MSETKYEDINDEMRPIAEKVIKEKGLDYINLDKVIFTKMNRNIKSDKQFVLARCVMMGRRTEFLTGKKYMIEFTPVHYSPEFTEEDREIVLWHELLHIPKKGKFLVPHEYEEFVCIMKEHSTKLFDIIGIANKKIKEQKETEKKIREEKKKLEKDKEKVKKLEEKVNKEEEHENGNSKETN